MKEEMTVRFRSLDTLAGVEEWTLIVQAVLELLLYLARHELRSTLASDHK